MRASIAAMVCGFALLAGGCGPTVDDTRSQPARFTVTVPAPWEKVTTCLTASYIDEYQPVSLPVASERRAEIVVYFVGMPGQRFAQAIFDVRGSEAGTTVTYRRRPQIGGDAKTEADAARRSKDADGPRHRRPVDRRTACLPSRLKVEGPAPPQILSENLSYGLPR